MIEAKTIPIRDDKGNRFVIPSYIIRTDGEDVKYTKTDILLNVMAVCQATHTNYDDWMELDLENFPHVVTEMGSRAFQHGYCTVWLFEGPIFDEIKSSADNEEKS